MTSQQNTLFNHLRSVIGARDRGDADAVLLERWLTSRNPAAFETLVARHGGMVYGVCARILRHSQDVEDAFQATFVIFVRKASSIGKRTSMGGWLYRVAYRVALEARARAQRRGQRETALIDAPAAETGDDLAWRELRPILDEELNRLPEKYRRPVLLCYLGGKTAEEAARVLNCPRGTVLTWLARARQRLHSRLTRRGISLSASVVGGLLAQHAAAAVPASLLHATVETITSSAAVLSETVVCISKGAMYAMWLSKIKSWVGVFVVLLGVGAGAGVFWHESFAAAPENEPVLLAARGAKKEPATVDMNKELEKFVGDWNAVAMEFSGRKVPEKVATQFKKSFTAKKVTMEGSLVEGGGKFIFRDGSSEMKYKIDPAKKPKAFDLILDSGKELPGIYEFKGDVLRICVDYAGAERPTEFTSKDREGVSLTVLKRAKK